MMSSADLTACTRAAAALRLATAVEDTAAVANRIAALNDRRCTLKAEIDRVLGADHAEFKIYQQRHQTS